MENNSLDFITPLIWWTMLALGFVWTILYPYLKFTKKYDYLKVRSWWMRTEGALFLFWMIWYIIQLIIQIH